MSQRLSSAFPSLATTKLDHAKCATTWPAGEVSPPRLSSGKSCPSGAAHWFPKRPHFIPRYFQDRPSSPTVSCPSSRPLSPSQILAAPLELRWVLSTSKSYDGGGSGRQKAAQRPPVAWRGRTAKPSSAKEAGRGARPTEGIGGAYCECPPLLPPPPGNPCIRAGSFHPLVHSTDSEQGLCAMSFCRHRTEAHSLLPLRARGLVSELRRGAGKRRLSWAGSRAPRRR